jgi:2-polyprenyl-3-methyl-5-hydroxy-6-metoxy-1,4-benzoquinol methylase
MVERESPSGRAPSSYVHGTAPEEQDRLGVLNGILNEGSLREAALQGSERIVDFGSGLGQLTRAMARAGGSRSRAVGIERSAEQIETATRLAREAGEEDRVDFRRGDVFDPPLRPDEWGAFDVAHARFVLEHVPDPAALVRVMVRAVRPGGRILLADEDHDILRLWPELPSVEKVWRAYIATYPRAGNDPYVGRKLVALLHDAGAKPRRSTWIWFGGSAGMDMFPHLIRNFAGVLESGRSAVLASKLLSVAEFDAAIADLDRWGKRPDAALWFAMAWAEGVKPG